MFDSDPSAKPVNAKLPRAVIMMIEKNNLVMAIKTLAAEEKISMEEAKARIDAYETKLKVKQQQKLTIIANKQGIPSSALNFDTEQIEDKFEPLSKDCVKTTPSQQGFKSLQAGLDSQLDSLGYKKPLLPHWAKRLLVIGIVMLGIFWILWRIFAQ